MSIIRQLGPGPTTLISGTKMAGFYGEFNNIPITPTTLSSLVELSSGNLCINRRYQDLVRINTTQFKFVPNSEYPSITSLVIDTTLGNLKAYKTDNESTLPAWYETGGYGTDISSLIQSIVKTQDIEEYTITFSEAIAEVPVGGFIKISFLYNDRRTSNINWLKFSHNYRTLFIADRSIRDSISWDNINTKGLIRGRQVTINGISYLVRVLQGANINPGSSAGGVNSEWDKCIVDLQPLNEKSHWEFKKYDRQYGEYTWCQEVHSYALPRRVIRGYDSASYFSNDTSSYANSNFGWRPVLEVL